jgi:hypothetical protein
VKWIFYDLTELQQNKVSHECGYYCTSVLLYVALLVKTCKQVMETFDKHEHDKVQKSIKMTTN